MGVAWALSIAFIVKTAWPFWPLWPTRESVALYVCDKDKSPCQSVLWVNSLAECHEAKPRYSHFHTGDEALFCVREVEFR
jgi:hypothetical protein